MDHFSLFPSSEMIAASLSRKTQHVRFVRVADFELMKELLEMAETQQSERERHVLAYDSEVAEGEASEVDTGGGQRTMGRIPTGRVNLTHTRTSAEDAIVIVMARPLSWEGLEIDLSHPDELQIMLRVVPEQVSMDMPRRDLAIWIAERAWPSVVDHTEGNKPYFKSGSALGFRGTCWHLAACAEQARKAAASVPAS